MARFQQSNVSFEPPAAWLDTTIASFRAPTAEPDAAAAPTILMAREVLQPADTLRTHADRKLVQLGREAQRFALVESKELQVGGRPALLLRYRLSGQDGRRLEQTTVMVDPAHDPEHKVAVFVMIAAAEQAEQSHAVFADMLTSVRFSETTGMEAHPGAASPAARRWPNEPPPPSLPMPGRKR